jgi:hypothetical protein
MDLESTTTYSPLLSMPIKAQSSSLLLTMTLLAKEKRIPSGRGLFDHG